MPKSNFIKHFYYFVLVVYYFCGTTSSHNFYIFFRYSLNNLKNIEPKIWYFMVLFFSKWIDISKLYRDEMNDSKFLLISFPSDFSLNQADRLLTIINSNFLNCYGNFINLSMKTWFMTQRHPSLRFSCIFWQRGKSLIYFSLFALFCDILYIMIFYRYSCLINSGRLIFCSKWIFQSSIFQDENDFQCWK